MSGLLGNALPALYGASNKLKKNVKGLLSDPQAFMESAVQGVLTDAMNARGLLSAAADESAANLKAGRGMEYGPANQRAATALADAYNPAGIFAGVGAKTADKAALARAQGLLGLGEDPAKVWQETGWAKGPDGHWRFEVSDHNARPLARTWGEGEDLKAGMSTTTRRQRALAHPDLSAAYPETKSIPVTLRPGNSTSGAYTEDEAFGPMISAYADPRYGHKANSSTVLHELQHAVQSLEGFSRGGSPKGMVGDSSVSGLSPHEAYLRLAGEAEARLVQSRMNMTPEQRRALYPYDPGYFDEATGVPLNSLIFR